jgi:hypothetical protein
VLKVFGGGHGLTAAGPLTVDDDMFAVRVSAVVTQAPQDPRTDANPTPPSAICHGDVHITHADLGAIRADPGAESTWTFDAETAPSSPEFFTGWARGTAFAVVTTTDGDLETYSWSEWVWLNRP